MDTTIATPSQRDFWFDARGFLLRFDLVPAGDAPGDTRAVLVLGRFDAGAYQHADYARFRIDCPPGVRGAVPSRQAEFLAGRLAAQYAMRQLGANIANIGQNADRSPAWPAGISGSLSHTRDICAAIVTDSDDTLTGVDVEKIASPATCEAIQSSVLTAADRKYLPRTTGLSNEEAVTMLFSAKESLFKALFPRVGRVFGFECAELVTAPETGALQLCLVRDLAPNLCRGHVFGLRYQLIENITLTWLMV